MGFGPLGLGITNKKMGMAFEQRIGWKMGFIYQPPPPFLQDPLLTEHSFGKIRPNYSAWSTLVVRFDSFYYPARQYSSVEKFLLDREFFEKTTVLTFHVKDSVLSSFLIFPNIYRIEITYAIHFCRMFFFVFLIIKLLPEPKLFDILPNVSCKRILSCKFLSSASLPKNNT